MNNRYILRLSVGLTILTAAQACSKQSPDQLQPEPAELLSGLEFAEGPVYKDGVLYFSDIDAEIIYSWTQAAGKKIYLQGSSRANGLAFNKSGSMLVCQGADKRIIALDSDRSVSVVADSYNNKQFNEPNDLWTAPNGDIYFTDPVYTSTLSQDCEAVYCIKSINGQVIRVISDLVRPNGITGNSDGSKLYVADWGDSKIFEYSISGEGTLAGKKLFASVRADGIEIDPEGNLYTASDKVYKYDSTGNLIDSFTLPGTVTNLCYVDDGNGKLFITTHNSVYILNFY